MPPKLTPKLAARLLKAATSKQLHVLETVCFRDGRALAGDLETFVSLPAAALGLAVTGEGCIPADPLAAAVKAGADRLNIAGETAALSDGQIGGVLPLEDYPAVSIPEPNLPAPHLAAALEAVRHATTRDNGRYSLAGILWGPGYAVATDGHRLSHVPAPTGPTEGAILPLEAVNLIKILQPDSWAEYTNPDGCRAIVFGRDDWRLETRPLEGYFPQWRKVIPTKEPAASTLIPRAEILSALEYLNKIGGADARTGAAPVRLTLANGDLGLSLETPNGGRYSRQIAGRGTGGVSLHANGRYLLQATKAVAGDRINLNLFNPDNQFMLGHDVIMPVRPPS